MTLILAKFDNNREWSAASCRSLVNSRIEAYGCLRLCGGMQPGSGLPQSDNTTNAGDLAMPSGKIPSSFVLAGVMLAPFAAGNAAIVTYVGPNVTYEYDNTQAAVAYFGLPTFSGDDVLFFPTVFRAESTDGVGIHSGTNTDAVSATFVFSKVTSNVPSNEIVSITAYEEGDYRIVSDGSVGGDLYLRARGLNTLSEPSLIDTDDVYAAGDSAGNQLWSMSATVTPSASLAQLANKLALTIQNDLSAFTDASGERAWIEKKLVLDITTVVPVPGAVWLLGSALGLIGLIRRRLRA